MAIQARTADFQELARTVTALYQIGDVVELRVLNGRLYCNNDEERGTLSGFFDDMGELANEVKDLSRFSGGQFYLTLNPVMEDCLQIARNTTKKSKIATSDHWIVRRRWLLIDCDPQRSKGFEKQSATDSEKEAARVTAYGIYDFCGGTRLSPTVASSVRGTPPLFFSNAWRT